MEVNRNSAQLKALGHQLPLPGKEDCGQRAPTSSWGWLEQHGDTAGCRNQGISDSLSLSLSREGMEVKNSTFPLWSVKQVDSGELKEPKQENPRRKKKKAAHRPPLQEMACSDSDSASHSTRSQEHPPTLTSNPSRGAGACLCASPGCSEVSPRS